MPSCIIKNKRSKIDMRNAFFKDIEQLSTLFSKNQCKLCTSIVLSEANKKMQNLTLQNEREYMFTPALVL